ncbi:hypothetical protein IGI04_039977 [Brassica rapa subsp. trilocularis]|uniref:Uncharacterized protein n=1 Tax=Brassica rapa subsp. trilocularis TaxID=1813537 RepID=A0ABQ7KQL9_BRACM|nr:hypothetical protein IGI04_039977 [Brassica rapa subsp. trilocularis]
MNSAISGDSTISDEFSDLQECWCEDELLSRYNDYFAKALSEILFPWLKMFNESPNFSTLNDVNPSFALIFELKKIILVLLTFPSPSTRVKTTEKVEAIYLLLKDMALSPDMPGGSNAMKHMFTFALRSAININKVEDFFIFV